MIAAMWNRRRMREMTHRERLAMIDRGLMPSAGGDSIRSDALSRSTRFEDQERGVRFRTAGVLMIGLGLALTVLIGFAAGQFEIGLGVGGAWAVFGAASLLNYFLMTRRPGEESYQRWTPPPRSSERPPDPGDPANR